MSARKLQSYFGATATLAALAGQAERVRALQQHWEQVAPSPLAQMCKVSGLQDQVLVLYANNGAIAAKVRQLAPTMLDKLKKRGLEVTAIQVRVQACFLAPEQKPIKTLRLGSAGVESLRQLAGRLEASPLKQALERLLERHAK
ncbi:MAG: DUF721 domain-containing protein [Sulfurimicrobium sp.]|nr:DUF721 domain-containing protein [Sulfurimicrobium sp.]